MCCQLFVVFPHKTRGSREPDFVTAAIKLLSSTKQSGSKQSNENAKTNKTGFDVHRL